jgi:hypothetical protein
MENIVKANISGDGRDVHASKRLLFVSNADHILIGNMALADVDKQLQESEPAV